MTSHQLHNEQGMMSPKKETSKNIDTTIFMEESPTGIMAFPGATIGGKIIIDPKNLKAPGLVHGDETVEEKLERQMASVAHFWTQAEQELISGSREFVIPRSESPFDSFSVNEGHVRHMVLKWNLYSQEEESSSSTNDNTTWSRGTPNPGPNVQKMAYFFDYFAQRLIQEEEMEPFVVYKTVSQKIAKIVATLEARAQFMLLSPAFASPVVHRHISAAIKPMVEFWNIKCAAGKIGPSTCLEPSSMHKNRRVVVMANLMKKKLDHTDVKIHEDVMPRKHNHVGPLVFQMVSLLEAMNHNLKTGGALPEVDKVHHVNPLPLVC